VAVAAVQAVVEVAETVVMEVAETVVMEEVVMAAVMVVAVVRVVQFFSHSLCGAHPSSSIPTTTHSQDACLLCNQLY